MQRSATMQPAALEKVIAMPVGSVRIPLRLGLTEAVGGEVLPELLVRTETLLFFLLLPMLHVVFQEKSPRIHSRFDQIQMLKILALEILSPLPRAAQGVEATLESF